MMFLSIRRGNISVVSGLFLTDRLDAPSGATMVLTATLIFSPAHSYPLKLLAACPVAHQFSTSGSKRIPKSGPFKNE
jgi:hypothetical protein